MGGNSSRWTFHRRSEREFTTDGETPAFIRHRPIGISAVDREHSASRPSHFAVTGPHESTGLRSDAQLSGNDTFRRGCDIAGRAGFCCRWSEPGKQDFTRAHATAAGNACPMSDLPRIAVGVREADIVGADNRALQAAVDFVAGLGGGLVEIGAGEYVMHDSLHLRSNVTVRGKGDATVLRKAPSTESPLATDGDFGEEQITLKKADGFAVGAGVAVWTIGRADSTPRWPASPDAAGTHFRSACR